MHDPHPRDAPDVRDVPVAREDHVDLQLAQDGHHVAGVAQVVDVTPRAWDGEDVVVDHEYPRPTVPAAELGVEPAIVLAPNLSLVEIRLGRVERDYLGLSLGDGDLGRPLPYAEELLEVPVADVLGVVVAHSVDYVRTLQTIEILFRLLELPAVSFHRQVTHDGNEVRLHSVALLYGGLQEILPKQPRTHVDIGHLYYPHCHSLLKPDQFRPSEGPSIFSRNAFACLSCSSTDPGAVEPAETLFCTLPRGVSSPSGTSHSAGCAATSSSCGTFSSGTSSSSHLRTSLPTASWASLKGIPFAARKSASSVARAKPPAASAIRPPSKRAVRNISGRTASMASTESTASKRGSLSSWRSFE